MVMMMMGGFINHSLRRMVALLKITMIIDDPHDQGHHDDLDGAED